MATSGADTDRSKKPKIETDTDENSKDIYVDDKELVEYLESK